MITLKSLSRGLISQSEIAFCLNYFKNSPNNQTILLLEKYTFNKERKYNSSASLSLQIPS